jgi:hypothetical protein
MRQPRPICEAHLERFSRKTLWCDARERDAIRDVLAVGSRFGVSGVATK